MTIEHEEAVSLRDQFGERFPHPRNQFVEAGVFTTDQLAALIAEVRRDEREKCAQDCEIEAKRWHGEQDIVDFRLCAAVIRARLEEGK